jgi:hypothetical protein
MLAMNARSRPLVICDMCYAEAPIAGGQVLTSVATLPGHLPQSLVACGDTCAAIGEYRLQVKPVKTMPLAAFLEALT